MWFQGKARSSKALPPYRSPKILLDVGFRSCSVASFDRRMSRACQAGHRGTRRARDKSVEAWRLLTHCRPGSLDLRFHGIEVEARALLHWRKLDRGHGQL